MTVPTNDSEPLLTPAEVAAMFRVDPKTVTRWAKAGKLSSVRTLGGHRRYLASEVKALLEGIPAPPASNHNGTPESPAAGKSYEETVREAEAAPTGLEPLPAPPATPGSSAGLPTSS